MIHRPFMAETLGELSEHSRDPPEEAESSMAEGQAVSLKMRMSALPMFLSTVLDGVEAAIS